MTRTLPLGYLLGSSSDTYLVLNLSPLGAPTALPTPGDTPTDTPLYAPYSTPYIGSTRQLTGLGALEFDNSKTIT